MLAIALIICCHLLSTTSACKLSQTTDYFIQFGTNDSVLNTEPTIAFIKYMQHNNNLTNFVYIDNKDSYHILNDDGEVYLEYNTVHLSVSNQLNYGIRKHTNNSKPLFPSLNCNGFDITIYLLNSSSIINPFDQLPFSQCMRSFCNKNHRQLLRYRKKKYKHKILKRLRGINYMNDEFDHFFDALNNDDYFAAGTGPKADLILDHENILRAFDGPDNAAKRTAKVQDSIFKNVDGVIKVTWPKGTDTIDKHPDNYFKFKDYHHFFGKGNLKQCQKKQVKEVRERTVYELLTYSIRKTDPTKDVNFQFDHDDDKWYDKIGSDSVTSDFDFNYIRWDRPRMVVPSLMVFYNRLFQLYQGWPLSVWDMNFYIASGFIRGTQGSTQASDPVYNIKTNYPEVAKLFREYNYKTKTALALGEEYKGGNKINFKKYDEWLGYYFIVQKGLATEFGMLGAGENDFEIELIQFAEIFYYIIWQVKEGKITFASEDKRDELKLYLKTLLYFMNYYSDESYVTNPGLQYMKDDKLDKYDDVSVAMAVLDNFAFIAEYYVNAMADERKNDIQKLFYFWDRCSKYLKRIGELLQRDEFKGKVPYKHEFLDQQALLDTLWQVESPTKNDLKPTMQPEKWLNIYSWARVWLKKEGGLTIRGDIENKWIIDNDGNVATTNVNDLAANKQKLIKRGRAVWETISKHSFRNKLDYWWKANTFTRPNTFTIMGDEQLTNIIFFIQDHIERKIGEKYQALKDGVIKMLYNICGKTDFVKDKASSTLFNALQDDISIGKNIVHAAKKYGRKGQKLSIQTHDAYNYQYKNPFDRLI